MMVRVLCILLLALAACQCSKSVREPVADPSSLVAEGAPIEPPFAVRGELEDLYLVWFDSDGTHTAPRRSEIPEPNRQYVRIDSLTLPPEQRLDPSQVYIADVRVAGPDGSYPVRQFARESFEALIDRAHGGSANQVAGTGDADVIIYGASWCGACRGAARFFEQEGVAFVEKDVERDPGAREEMMRKAQAAGVPTGSIPIIDFRGTIMRGFDQPRLTQLLRGGAKAI